VREVNALRLASSSVRDAPGSDEGGGSQDANDTNYQTLRLADDRMVETPETHLLHSSYVIFIYHFQLNFVS